MLLELLLPLLTTEQVNLRCPDGKTALFWAGEMASVASITVLMKVPGIDVSLTNNKGFTILDVLNKAEPSGIIDRIKAALLGTTDVSGSV